jgi:hypothetical protein
VGRLRAEVTELQGRWEALGEELEAKRQRLRLAEATMELMERQQEEKAGNGAVHAEGGLEDVPHPAQASVVCMESPLRLRPVPDCDAISSHLAQAGSVAGGKRPHPAALADRNEEGPRLSLVTALPLSVWQEHLIPVVSTREAAGLRVVCRALKALALEWPVDTAKELRVEYSEDLQAALTCFPATKTLDVYFDAPLEAAEESRIMELLRRHGGTLKYVTAYEEGAERLFFSAVQGGALANLKNWDVKLENPLHRQILSGGMLRLLEDVDVDIKPGDEEQLAASEHLRNLPQLRRLFLRWWGDEEAEVVVVEAVAFPPFIPPSVKTLKVEFVVRMYTESLLRDLPDMLRESGAKLQDIQIYVQDDFCVEAASALDQVLRICSSTLKSVGVLKFHYDNTGTSYARELVPGLISCCDTLEVLSCHWAVFSALPAPLPTFSRLTKLFLMGERPDEFIRFTPRAWDIMANGGLPALTDFTTRVLVESTDEYPAPRGQNSTPCEHA